MNEREFSDAALILAAHGSLVSPESSAAVYQHADELRRRGLFAQVLEGFWKLEPSLAAVRRGVWAARTFVVPFFASAGYFTEHVLPRELGLVPAPGSPSPASSPAGGRVHYCQPVGTHPGMTEVILERAREVVARHPFPRPPRPEASSLFLVGHGTWREPNSRRAVEDQAARLRERGGYAHVGVLFLEESPRIAECYALAPTAQLVIVPFFMSEGFHVQEQIPVLLGAPADAVRARLGGGRPGWRNPSERQGKRVWYAACVGTAPRLAEVILARVREAEPGGADSLSRPWGTAERGRSALPVRGQ